MKQEEGLSGSGDARSAIVADEAKSGENSSTGETSQSVHSAGPVRSNPCSGGGNSPIADTYGVTQRAKGTSSNSSSQDDDTNDASSMKSVKTKKKKEKLDRSKLRKGKWTVSLEAKIPGLIAVLNVVAKLFSVYWKLTYVLINCVGRRGRVYIADHSLL